MPSPFAAPTPEQHAELIAEIGPLPITGAAWPGWVKVFAWIVVAVMAIQIARTLSMQDAAVTLTTMGLIVLFCFLGLAAVTFYMQRSVTTINTQGLQQTWIMRREVAWGDIQFAKFVPLLASKRLVVFTKRGRPLVFQGSTRELQVAFAKISLLYRRKSH